MPPSDNFSQWPNQYRTPLVEQERVPQTKVWVMQTAFVVREGQERRLSQIGIPGVFVPYLEESIEPVLTPCYKKPTPLLPLPSTECHVRPPLRRSDVDSGRAL